MTRGGGRPDTVVAANGAEFGVQAFGDDGRLVWRDRTPSSDPAVPTLADHAGADPFFPLGNGEALAGDIPAARLLVLDDLGTT